MTGAFTYIRDIFTYINGWFVMVKFGGSSQLSNSDHQEYYVFSRVNIPYMEHTWDTYTWFVSGPTLQIPWAPLTGLALCFAVLRTASADLGVWDVIFCTEKKQRSQAGSVLFLVGGFNPLKNISRNGNLFQIGVKIKNINHR